MPRSQRPEPIFFLWPLAALFLGWGICTVSAETVVLHLKSGDRVSGVVMVQDTNRIVLSNRWASALSVPLAEIERREAFSGGPPAAATNAAVASLKPAKAPAPAAVKRHWQGEAQVGLDLLYSATDRQIYSGKLKLIYQDPYKSDPKQFFKSTFEYSVEYGKTDGLKSSDRMDGSDKSDTDLTRKWYVYNLAEAGYDHILKINLQYEAGPGLGYHLFAETNFLANLEGGMNYQAQYRSDNTRVRDVYYRFAEDVTWKLGARTTFAEKFEFFPRVNLNGYRSRLDSSLAYELWKNVALKLSLLDLYDSEPATDVGHNELEIRSSLGLKF